MKEKDIEKLKELVMIGGFLVDYRPLIGAIMRACGCSLQEIGHVFGMSRQAVHSMLKSSERAK